MKIWVYVLLRVYVLLKFGTTIGLLANRSLVFDVLKA